MVAAALPALAKPPRETLLTYQVRMVESDGARHEQTITRLEVRL